MKKSVLCLLVLSLSLVLFSCGEETPEHTIHTYRFIAYEETHFKEYTCGCPSPEIAMMHFDNDGDNLCDDCKYLLKINLTFEEAVDIIEDYYQEENVVDQIYDIYKHDGKYVIVFMPDGWSFAESKEETVGGITFTYSNSHRIKVYCDNQIYSLKEAYERNLITKANLTQLEKIHHDPCRLGHTFVFGTLSEDQSKFHYVCEYCDAEKTKQVDSNNLFDITITGDTNTLVNVIPSIGLSGEMYQIITHKIMDADIVIYINGKNIGPYYEYDSDYWYYSFTMPNEDITIDIQIEGGI